MKNWSAHSDVIVVGGGTIGLFAALTLAESGRSVTVLDRGRVWSEASATNAGSLAVQNKLVPLVSYTVAAHDLWRDMATRLGAGIEYHRTGGYKIATTEAEVERLRNTAEAQRREGLEIIWLDGAEIRAELPWLSRDVLAATWCALDGYANPLRLGPALLRLLRQRGVRIVENAAVIELEETSVIHARTQQGTFTAKELVIAAGVWSAGIAAKLGAVLPIALDVNMISVTEPGPRTIARIVTHARGILTLKQVANGSCLIGGGWQGVGTLEDNRKGLDYSQLIHNLRLAARVVPGLKRLHVLRSWAGYEGVTPDSLPFLGKLQNCGNVYVAACARGGFSLGPVLGKLVGELMTTGETSMPVAIFNPGRFGNA